jgi:prepilin-type N-terminal cleavage/methylation domain-containing protein
MRSIQQFRDLRHRGFTLLELLIVIAIIGVLLTISVQVSQVFIVQAERNSTRATIRKINGLLNDRIEAYDRIYTGETRRRFIRAIVSTLEKYAETEETFTYALKTPDEAESALRVLARKTGFRYYFPQKMADLTDFEPSLEIPGVSDVLYSRVMAPLARQQLIDGGNPNPTANEIKIRATSNWNLHDPSTESSELLYYFLLSSTAFGSSSLDADQFNGSEVMDTDGDGLPEFVDRWGQPLRFYRWPTRLIRPTGTSTNITNKQRDIAAFVLKGLPPPPFLPGTPDLAFRDPEDPAGLLVAFVLKYPQYPKIEDIVNQNFYHTPETFHSPLIVSAGFDQQLGLLEPSDTLNYGHLAQPDPDSANEDFLFDNIFNSSGSIGGGQ